MKDNDALLFCEFRLLIYIVDAKRPNYYYYARSYVCTVADPEQIFSWGAFLFKGAPPNFKSAPQKIEYKLLFINYSHLFVLKIKQCILKKYIKKYITYS